MTTALPAPGIYADVPFEQYLAWPAVNNSSLDWMAKSPAHFRYALGSGLIREETPAMRLGTLCHAGKFEPLRIIERYAVMPAFEDQVRKPNGGRYDNPRASAAYKAEVDEWKAEHAGKIIVERREYEMMQGIVRSIDRHPVAGRILASEGETELSLVWLDPKTGIPCKARLDFVRRSTKMFADLKTTADASDWRWIIKKRAYHRQFAFYRFGWHTLTGDVAQVFNIVAETVEPFCVRAAAMSESLLEAGADLYRSLLDKLDECNRKDEWPGYDDPDEWDFQIQEAPVNVIIGGQKVAV